MSIPPLPAPSNHFEGDFDAWVRHVFDHPAPANEDPWSNRPWFFEIEADSRTPADDACVRYWTRLCRDPAAALASYSDGQIAQGLQFLAGIGQHHAWSLVYGAAPLKERITALESIGDLFRRLFSVRCTPTLGHLDEAPTGPLNGVCYMWWDSFPTYGHPGDPQHAEADATILQVMRECLEMDHAAVLESALHGLGHWQQSYPDVVRATIDEFLDRRRRQKVLRHKLVLYARAAREGYVQ